MLKLWAALMATLTLSVSACGYSTLHMQDRHVRVYWADVLNQYQQRAELALQLVAAASKRGLQDNQTQTQLNATRASANAPRGSLDLIDNPTAFAGFETAQAELSESLAKLLLAYESEPIGASDDDLRYLKEQLERAEQRIASARSRYSEAVRDYNASVRSFPSNLTASLIGHRARPDFVTDSPKHVPSKPKQVGSRLVRARILTGLEAGATRAAVAPEMCISAPGSATEVWVIGVDEPATPVRAGVSVVASGTADLQQGAGGGFGQAVIEGNSIVHHERT